MACFTELKLNTDICGWYRYKDQQAINNHLATPYLAQLMADEDNYQLKRAPNQIHFLDDVYRFIR